MYVGIEYRGDTTRGAKLSAQKAKLLFKDTLSAKIGQDETNVEAIKFASSSSLNTEDVEAWLSNAYQFLQTVYVVQDEPQPCTLLSMIVDVETG